ncbi:MAG: hypothetical protein IKY31_02065 [Bacteroidaceae bacterium]|nr:hypothetical protein [Bacteroidaceae bacterium]
MSSEDDFLLDDAVEDAKTVAFIRNYLPQEYKEHFTDDDLYYFLDLIFEYYATSGCLDAEPDEEGYINIDQEEIVEFLLSEAKKDKMDRFSAEELLFVVQGEMEYGNSLNEDEV